jgi:uncharacterized protein
MRFLLTFLPVLFAILLHAGQAVAASPAFDCARADGAAEELICKDDELAALDREVQRLFDLAVTTPDMEKAQLDELKATQRGWIKGRNDCWKAEKLGDCIAAEYIFRIHQLRQAYANARSDDAKGISIGPQVLDCKDFGALIGVTFVTAGNSYAHLEWLDQDLFVKQAEAASGVRYEGQYLYDGPATLWTKGDEATFTLPGKPDYTCRIEEGG